MAGKPGGLGDKKLISIGGENRYGFIEPDVERVKEIKKTYLAGDEVLMNLKATYNGQGLRASPATNRKLNYGKPTKVKNP